ncbi:MAG: tRNA nucleotidyltransferase (CCA-adding enzyme) [Myxococcota bacterium]|jgi:tRNA nucleotidyltransferase (CCA-adding enzyme)
MNLPSKLIPLLATIREAGGRAWLVGGSVRDHLLGLTPKDLDIEVHHLSAEALEALLARQGRVNAVGRSFGVFKLRLGRDELDIGLPQSGRARTPQGEPIVVAGDPDMGIVEALRRRDLTINAIAYDPLNGEYADPFDGRADLKRQVLDAVDEQTFSEDPLRVLRVMQLAGRLGFTIAPRLARLCQTLPIAELPGERLLVEFEKLLLKSPLPSIGLRAAREADIFPRLLPALAEADGPALDSALDRAVAERRRQDPPLALMLAVLLHRCEPEGVVAILDRLKVFTLNRYPLRQRIVHATAQWPSLTTPTSDRELCWMAESGELALTARVAWAATGDELPRALLLRAGALGIAHKPLPPLIRGRDLGEQGIPPGPWMGTLLRRVRTAQLDGTIQDKEDALAMSMRLWRDEDPRGGTG